MLSNVWIADKVSTSDCTWLQVSPVSPVGEAKWVQWVQLSPSESKWAQANPISIRIPTKKWYYIILSPPNTPPIYTPMPQYPPNAPIPPQYPNPPHPNPVWFLTLDFLISIKWRSWFFLKCIEWFLIKIVNIWSDLVNIWSKLININQIWNQLEKVFYEFGPGAGGQLIASE